MSQIPQSDFPVGMLAISGGDEFSTNPGITHTLTLRDLCIRYSNMNGAGWRSTQTTCPELDGSMEPGQMCRMRGFVNVVGIPGRDESEEYALEEKSTVVISFPPSSEQGMVQMLNSLARDVNRAISSRMLWCPPGTVEFRKPDNLTWKDGGDLSGDDVSSILDSIQASFLPPVSIYSCHAFYESQRRTQSSWFRRVFLYKSQVTPMPGLLGTLANNTNIDMCIDENPADPDTEARRYEDRFKGVICCAHTPHGADAGMGRRCAMDTKVRLISHDTLNALLSMRESANSTAANTDLSWTVYCMGRYCRTSFACIRAMALTVSRMPSYERISIGFYTDTSLKILVINISTGALVKLCSNGIWADTTEINLVNRIEVMRAPRVDEEGDDLLRSTTSPYFSTVSYVEYDRPPRPLFSSVQTQQAVCSPWSPGTAVVSPNYTFRPLVQTPFLRNMYSRPDDEISIPDEFPGIDLVVCYMNLPENYEDAILVSRGFIQRGGFSSMSKCVYVLPLSEYVPPRGSRLCTVLSPWWKSGCQEGCKHTIDDITKKSRTFSTSPKVPTGRVFSSKITSTGHMSVEVLSFAFLQEGDKLSTPHGQKGVCVTQTEELPIGIDREGEMVFFDAIISTSAIVNRETNGQIYEGIEGIRRLRYGNDLYSTGTGIGSPFDLEEEVVIVDPATGMPMPRILHDGSVSKMTATYGALRVFSQTQMTRERHHSTHTVPGRQALSAPVGRSKGGPLRIGEMEVQALWSVGMTSVLGEVSWRFDNVTVQVCTGCRRIITMHRSECDKTDKIVKVSMPYGLLTLAHTLAVTHDKTFEFNLSI